jgi:glucokinase-like ROK family protein
LYGSFWANPQTHVKSLNKHVVVDLIRFVPGGISRAELSRHMGLTRAAVTSIINDLSGAGMVQEASGSNSGGRRPAVLEIVADQGYVVGVDMGATHITALVADYSARVIREREIVIDINLGPEVCLEQLDRVVQQVVAEAGLQMVDINAIGLGVPGPVVIDRGVVSAPPIMPGWDDFPIRDTMQKKWGCTVRINNDAELGALGEWAYGAGRGESNLAYIKVGSGVGAGLMFDSNIYHGTTGSAGEIGHITLSENGPLCTCGNRGCLEAYAGGNAIAKRAMEEVKRGRRTQLVGFGDFYRITAKDVIMAARNGDLLSQQILAEAGSHLGTAIASLVNLFNPSIVVIGGGVAQSGDLLLDPIRSTVGNRSLAVAAKAVRISSALLGRRASAMGAVVQALSHSLHQFVE